MKRTMAAAAIAMLLGITGAHAQERAGNAALGALSGGLLLGPVGAVAGAAVGYTAGPAIARSWGFRGSSPRRPKRTVTRRAPQKQAVQSGPAARSTASDVPAPPPRPAQVAPAARSATSHAPPPAPRPAQAAGARGGTVPPIVGFE